MSVKVTGIHHIALKARGLEQFRKTVAFYHELLGLPVARTWGEGENVGIMLDTGAGLIESHPHDISITKESPNYSSPTGA